MNVFEIPLTADAQTFTITLGAVEYQLTVVWRDAVDGGWFLNIADAQGVSIIAGIPLVTGCNLLEQYDYLSFGGELRVQTDNDPDTIPTFDNLGTNSHLYFVTA